MFQQNQLALKNICQLFYFFNNVKIKIKDLVLLHLSIIIILKKIKPFIID